MNYSVHSFFAPSLLTVLQYPFISIIVMCDEGFVDPLNRQVAAQNTAGISVMSPYKS